MSGRPKQTFLQKRHTDGQQAHEKMLVIRKMQIKTTMRYHLTLVRMAIILKSLKINNATVCVEKREPSYTAGGNVKYTATMESMEVP